MAWNFRLLHRFLAALGEHTFHTFERKQLLGRLMNR